MVVSGDAYFLFPVVDRCRNGPRHPGRDVDRKSMEPPRRLSQLSELGKLTFWSLLVYMAFRLGDLAVRGQISTAFSGRYGALFSLEIVLGGVVPLGLLAKKSVRQQSKFLFIGALLAVLGVVFNRINVVLLAMDLRGPMPQNAPETYSPSIFEWGISIGLIAATIFLFGLGARLLPLLPKSEGTEELAQ